MLFHEESNGRPLDSLLYGSVIHAKEAILLGQDQRAALAVGLKYLDLYVQTQVSDSSRVASGVAIASRPRLAGWVRMVNSPCCKRCAIQTGKFFRWNQGFKRHPNCDCRHIPASEDLAGELGTDPDALWRSGGVKDLTFAERRALTEGADFSKVVNANRGLYLDEAGRKLTREDVKRSGRSGIRPTPEQIYREAKSDRAGAIQLLRHFGYLTS